MKQVREFPQVIITRKGARFLGEGHPWVFEGEVIRMEPAPNDGREAANGDLVDVRDEKGTYLGTGLLSMQSKIRVRLVSRNANDRFDQAFWTRKVSWAWEYRKRVMAQVTPYEVRRAMDGLGADAVLAPGGVVAGGNLECCRVIYSEADAFPGLVVDRYGDILVAEVNTFGMELLAPLILPIVVEVLEADGIAIQGVYLRNDSSVRLKEGLELTKGWLELEGHPTPASTRRVVCENGVRYDIDFEHSQKTGFFLDQKFNRQAVARLAPGLRVLDCFTHVGTFALNAAAAGASFVRGVDVSQTAVDLCRGNAALNGLDDVTDWTCANVLDYLPTLEADRGRSEGGPFDLIILDPPAFTKSRDTARNASRGYKQINARALKLLPRGGYLATCSCSHFMPTDQLAKVVGEAAHDAGVQLRQVEARQQAPDHPIAWGVPESDYLKFFIFQVV